jgi:hypothetical protein
MVNLIYSGAVLLLFAAILFVGAKRDNTSGRKNLLKRFNLLRGFFAVEIIVGHTIRYESTILYPLGKFMIVSVAFFFFVSAVGMVSSFETKREYLKLFLVKKCCYLFVIALIAYLFNVALSRAVGVKTVYSLGVLQFFKQTNWYIWEMIAFYVLFYVVFKFAKCGRWQIIASVTIAVSSILFLFGWKEEWYASAFAFPFGIFYGENYEKCNKFLFGKKGILLTAATAVLGTGSLLLGETSLLGMVYLRNVFCIASLIVLIYALSFFEFDNRVLGILTKYSTELYLFQFVYLRISEKCAWDFKIRMLFVLLLTAVTAVIIHPIFANIKKLFTGGKI